MRYRAKTWKRFGAMAGSILGVATMMAAIAMGKNLVDAVCLALFSCAGVLIGGIFERRQENVMLPRLDTIESCYTDTYHRYRNNADKMEAVVDDVDLLKRVVSEHSEKLQKIG